MSKHTPGPWTVKDASTGLITTEQHPFWHIAHVHMTGKGHTADANAALIAAAPELLEALEWLYLQFFTDGKPDEKKVARTPAVKLHEIKKLIAKVKGDQNEQ